MTDGPPRTKHLASQRRDYAQHVLHDDYFQNQSPHELVRLWLNDAMEAGLTDATAMTLATVDELGWPDARIVLLKGLSEEGWDFYTNYGSAKVKHLDSPPHMAAAVIYWATLERQVRVRGPVQRLEREISEAYFASRPRTSQLSAWASAQSQPVENREQLEVQYREQAEQYPEGTQIPLPPFWGGVRLSPLLFEFWQGRSNRLHDRFRAQKNDDGRWQWIRLAP